MKLIYSYQKISGLIILFLIFTGFAFEGSPDKVKGKAIYSDDLSPVRGGTIEIVSVETPEKGRTVLEKVNINPDGTFLISRNFVNLSDEIKIMAYPNDVDGSVPEFENSEFSPADVIVQTKEDFELILKVVRRIPETQ